MREKGGTVAVAAGRLLAHVFKITINIPPIKASVFTDDTHFGPPSSF